MDSAFFVYPVNNLLYPVSRQPLSFYKFLHFVFAEGLEVDFDMG